MVVEHATEGAAKDAVIAAWEAVRWERPAQSQIILAHTRADVAALNARARAVRRGAGEQGAGRVLQTERGKRAFAEGDPLYFLQNDRGLGVKNGTLGTVERIEAGSIQDCIEAGTKPEAAEQSVTIAVRLDDGRRVSFDMAHYAHIDHGYAATVHKAQGVTVDRAHVLAPRGLDRHAAYVGLSRHRESVSLHWSAEEMGSREGLVSRLSRERLKDTSLDYGFFPAEADAERERMAEAEADAARAYAARRGLAPESAIVVREMRERPGEEKAAPARSAYQASPISTPEAEHTTAALAAGKHDRPMQKRRGMFAGLKLGRAERIAAVEPPPETLAAARSAEVRPTRETEYDRLEQASVAYARAWADAARLSAAEEQSSQEGGRGLREAQGQMAAQARALEAIVGAGRSREEQRGWLACVGVLGVAIGMLGWLVVAVPLIRSVSQAWIDEIATVDLGATPWDAGMGLMQPANPPAWNALVEGWSIRQAGGKELQACYAAMQNSGKAQRCSVTLRPETKTKER